MIALRLLALALLAGLLGLAVPPRPALALEHRHGDTVAVASSETIDDDLAAAGQTVTIAGHVTGDVFAAGQNVVVTGTIDGDLLAAGEQVTVAGSVLGDVRAAGAQGT